MNTWFVLLVLTLVLVFEANTDLVEVTIKNGPIVGDTVVENATNRVVFRFLGIPYAKPPVGSLRFRRPQPADFWTEPLKAQSYSKSCVHTTNLFDKVTELSEDCLYLNVWSPDVSVDEQHLLPVLVWIHGGYLTTGSSCQYDSTVLSAKADAVIVTINYRLSTLGFLYSEEVKESGNQGLWDQALALEWIQDNIRYFGGDPNKVTLVGGNSGAWSVSAHILSPVSRNLFKNAYLMSGSAIYGIFVTPEQYYARMLPGIRSAGCAADNDTIVNRKVFECLQKLCAVKVDSIINDYIGLPIGRKLQLGISVVDGEFMPASPYQMLKDGNYKTNFSLLISTVENEGSIWFRDDSRFDPNNPTNLTLADAKKLLHEAVINYTGVSDFNPVLANLLYLGTVNENHVSMDLFRKQVRIGFGDLTTTCPTLLFARDIFRSNPDSIRVYQVHYTFKPTFYRSNFCAPWDGVCHTTEIPYVFGKVFNSKDKYLIRQRDIANEMINFLSSFTRTGDPGEEHSEWHPYVLTPDGLNVIAPYYELANNYKTHQSYGFNLKQIECDHIWSQFYQQ